MFNELKEIVFGRSDNKRQEALKEMFYFGNKYLKEENFEEAKKCFRFLTFMCSYYKTEETENALNKMIIIGKHYPQTGKDNEAEECFISVCRYSENGSYQEKKANAELKKLEENNPTRPKQKDATKASIEYAIK